MFHFTIFTQKNYALALVILTYNVQYLSIKVEGRYTVNSA